MSSLLVGKIHQITLGVHLHLHYAVALYLDFIIENKFNFLDEQGFLYKKLTKSTKYLIKSLMQLRIT